MLHSPAGYEAGELSRVIAALRPAKRGSVGSLTRSPCTRSFAAGRRLDVRAVAADEALGVAAAAAELALQAGARLAHVALELVAGGGAAALELADALLGGCAGRGDVAQVVDERDGAVARLERGADVHERGALGDVAALLGGRLRGADVGLGGLARLVRGDRAGATTAPSTWTAPLRCERVRRERVERFALARFVVLGRFAVLARFAGVVRRGLRWWWWWSQPCGEIKPLLVRSLYRT